MKESFGEAANDNAKERIVSNIEREDAKMFLGAIEDAKALAKERAKELETIYVEAGKYPIDTENSIWKPAYDYDPENPMDRRMMESFAWLVAVEEMLDVEMNPIRHQALTYLHEKAIAILKIAQYDAYEASLAAINDNTKTQDVL